MKSGQLKNLMSAKQTSVHLMMLDSGFGTVNRVHMGEVVHMSEVATMEGMYYMLNRREKLRGKTKCPLQ